MYPSPLPHVTHFPANKKTSQYFFMDEKLRETLTAKNEAIINPIGSGYFCVYLFYLCVCICSEHFF